MSGRSQFDRLTLATQAAVLDCILGKVDDELDPNAPRFAALCTIRNALTSVRDALKSQNEAIGVPVAGRRRQSQQEQVMREVPSSELVPAMEGAMGVIEMVRKELLRLDGDEDAVEVAEASADWVWALKGAHDALFQAAERLHQERK